MAHFKKVLIQTILTYFIRVSATVCFISIKKKYGHSNKMYTHWVDEVLKIVCLIK